MEKKQTIGNITAIAIVLVAVVLDGIQFLLTLSVFLLPLTLLFAFFGGVGLGVWFFLLGAYSGRGAEKKALTSLVTVIAEFLPIINVIPAFTAGAVINILLSRFDDLKKEVGADPKKTAALTRLQRMKAAQAQRRAGMAEEREATQGARHGAANDNEPAAANDNDSAEESREAA